MTAALLVLAAALVLWPGRRRRTELLSRGPRAARRTGLVAVVASPVPAGIVALCVTALLSTPLVAVLAGGCAALGARGWASSRRAARQGRALAALAEGLSALGAELRAGRSAEEAVGSAAAACADETTGMRLVAAVRDPRGQPVAGSDVLSAALGRTSAAVTLSTRTGCSLADVVAAVEDDLRARLRTEQELRSATAAPRAGAVLLATLPVLGLAMGAGVGADPWGVLTTTAGGQALLVAGVGLELAGVVWSGRLVRQAVR